MAKKGGGREKTGSEGKKRVGSAKMGILGVLTGGGGREKTGIKGKKRVQSAKMGILGVLTGLNCTNVQDGQNGQIDEYLDT